MDEYATEADLEYLLGLIDEIKTELRDREAHDGYYAA